MKFTNISVLTAAKKAIDDASSVQNAQSRTTPAGIDFWL
jgi:hypothetical protein